VAVAISSAGEELLYISDTVLHYIQLEHPPFPCLGSVVQKGEGWQWQPIEIAHD
jgi:hypothetical protein